MSSSAVLYLYVALGQRRGQDALHWIILAVPEGSDRCTYYHVVGGPPQGNNYELQIQANKRVNSNGISASEYVGTIAKSDVNNLKASAQRIAPQFCQSWVVGVLEDVERKGVGEEYLIGEYGSRHMERHQPVTPASNKRATWHLVARTYLSHPALPALHFLVDRYQSENCDPSPLGRPLKFEFSGRVAKNRFLKAAMTERLSSWDPKDFEARGIPTKNLMNVYKRWGEGGFGQILTGNIMIEFDQLEAMGNLIIPPTAEFSGPRFDAFKELATQAKAHGSLCVGQVNHPGRQVEYRMQKNPISASDVHLKGSVMGMEFAKPHAATQEEIDHVIDSFAHSAEFLEKAGYDGIEFHGAHGYLLAQFLSPSTNKRKDKYGGSLENRLRLILEVADACRERVSRDFIFGIKVNSVEFQDQGFSPEDAKGLCQALEQARFDYVELSGGTYESFAFFHKRESTKKRESFFIEFAKEIVQPLSKTKTYITGGFKTAGAMVRALDTVDGVGLARTVCQEPHLPMDILEGKVRGSIRLKLDDDNFGATNMAAGTQIRQLGKDQEPIDLSDQKNFDAFMKDMETWAQKMGSDKDMKEFGYIDLSQAGKPYVSPIST